MGPTSHVIPNRLPLRVAMIALYYDYGRPSRGPSYEYINIYLSLKELYEEVLFFDYYKIYAEKGRQAMNQAVLDFVRSEKPDLTIFTMFEDGEFIPEIVASLQEYTTTLSYFFDDVWRMKFAEEWAPHFNYFTTPSISRVLRYRDLGYRNYFYSPYGYNPQKFVKKDVARRYDVTFVGGHHPWRKWVIDQLGKAGIKVAVWGAGPWKAGRLSFDDLSDVFNASRISLNLSNSVNWHLPYLLSSPRALQIALRSPKTKEQLKGRMFELCGCGTFQLTYYSEGLEQCFRIGDELAVYSDVDDLIFKIRYYLKHEDERESIAASGYERALAEHTYLARFEQITHSIFPHLENRSKQINHAEHHAVR